MDEQPEDDDITLVDDPSPHSGEAAITADAVASPPPPERVPELAGMREDSPEDEDDGLGLGRGVGTHLEELRRRLILSLCVFVPLFIVGVAIYRNLWDIVIRPLERAAPHLLRFQALGPSDGLVMSMRIAFAFAMFLSLPVWLSQAWNFIAPGLTGRERRGLYLSLGSGTALFIIGAALAYFIGVPLALEFLLPFNQSLAGWENAFTGTDYVDFVITCCAGFGLAFELPLVMLALGFVGILTPAGLRQWWRVIILAIFVLAAVMTPPDPFTQMMLALPMLLLFAIGFVLVRWVHRKTEE
jgi:sec-independent protein translocase protein TatC